MKPYWPRQRARLAGRPGVTGTIEYLLRVEVADLATDLVAARPELSVRERHDVMLAHGSPAPRHLRTVLGL